MRAVQITRSGGPEVLDLVDLPDPVPGEGQQVYDVSTAGVNFADTHCGGSGVLRERDEADGLGQFLQGGQQGRRHVAVDVGQDIAEFPSGGENLAVDVEPVLADQCVST